MILFSNFYALKFRIDKEQNIISFYELLWLQKLNNFCGCQYWLTVWMSCAASPHVYSLLESRDDYILMKRIPSLYERDFQNDVRPLSCPATIFHRRVRLHLYFLLFSFVCFHSCALWSTLLTVLTTILYLYNYDANLLGMDRLKVLLDIPQSIIAIQIENVLSTIHLTMHKLQNDHTHAHTPMPLRLLAIIDSWFIFSGKKKAFR